MSPSAPAPGRPGLCTRAPCWWASAGIWRSLRYSWPFSLPYPLAPPRSMATSGILSPCSVALTAVVYVFQLFFVPDNGPVGFSAQSCVMVNAVLELSCGALQELNTRTGTYTTALGHHV